MSAEPRFATDAQLTLVASSMSADPRARRRPPKARPGERADSGRPARDRPSGLHFRFLEGQPCAVANVARTDYASWPKDASPGTRPNRKPPACGHRASKSRSPGPPGGRRCWQRRGFLSYGVRRAGRRGRHPPASPATFHLNSGSSRSPGYNSGAGVVAPCSLPPEGAGFDGPAPSQCCREPRGST